MPRSTKEWVGKTDDSSPTREVRLRIYEAANGICAECGLSCSGKKWELDHHVRLRDGGENRESNLRVLCAPCHKAKSSAENKAHARARRIKARHLGIKKRKGGFRGWRRFDGTIRWRDE